MTPRPIRIQTPSRLHFGLLSWGPNAPRQFGGVGLMIDAPGLELSAEPALEWKAEGPLASRVLQVARRVSDRLEGIGVPVSPAHFRVFRAPEEHAGLGVGTQLSLAVARLLTRLAGLPDPSAEQLADLSGRGLRSGIGLHGFLHGGLIVDGGRRAPEGFPPLLSRLEFPAEWSVLVLVPERNSGLHGPEEAQAFAALPPIPEDVTDRLSRLVLLGLMPAVIERDLAAFGEALTEIQGIVGQCFAPAQGGPYARPELERLVKALRAEGLHGVGQSSWGPTLYGFSREPEPHRAEQARRLRDQLQLGGVPLFWTQANRTGAVM